MRGGCHTGQERDGGDLNQVGQPCARCGWVTSTVMDWVWGVSKKEEGRMISRPLTNAPRRMKLSSTEMGKQDWDLWKENQKYGLEIFKCEEASGYRVVKARFWLRVEMISQVLG